MSRIAPCVCGATPKPRKDGRGAWIVECSCAPKSGWWDKRFAAVDDWNARIKATKATPKPPAGGDAGARELLGEAIEHIGLLVSVDPGPKANAVFAAARAWFERQDAALALPAPVVEAADWMHIARESVAAALPGSAFAKRVMDGRHDDSAEIRAAMRAIDATLAALSEGRSHG